MNPNVILCPIDSSASGPSALVQAVQLARWYNADLHVARVRGGRARRQTPGEPLNTGGIDGQLSSFMKEVDTEGLRLSTVELAGDPVDVYVNDRMIARGEILVLNENFCVRVTELLSGS